MTGQTGLAGLSGPRLRRRPPGPAGCTGACCTCTGRTGAPAPVPAVAPPARGGSGPPGLSATPVSAEAVAAMGLLPGRAPQQSGQPAEAPERCELCATEVRAEHGHIADLEGASLLCACRACYLLFTQQAAGRGRYRAVPDRYLPTRAG